jgi:hypothetical protein
MTIGSTAPAAPARTAPPLSFAEIEARIDAPGPADPVRRAGELLALGEAVLEAWVRARGGEPTGETREGFRILALHRQGAKGEPSFNACRETVRELVYHFNLVALDPGHPDARTRLSMMAMVARHLALFVGGKLEVAGLGEFCCSSKPMRGRE